VAALLLVTTASQGEAQFRGGGGRGYGFGNGGRGGSGISFGIGGGGIGVGIGHQGYYGNNYYGNGFYGNYGSPYYGYGHSYGYQPYGYNSNYGSYYGTPSYTTLQPIQDTTVYPYNSYQSSYPPSSVIPTDMSNNTAMIEVTVPADAELWFDGTKTQQTGTKRYFTTPPLPPGQTFTYEVRMGAPNGGDNSGTTRRVEVQAGKRSTVNFTETAGTPR